MSRKIKKAIAVLCLLVLIGSVYMWLVLTTEPRSLLRSRTEYATMKPDLNGEITDVRITVKPREFTPSSRGSMSAAFEGLKYLQICYGYERNGKWFDIPCENYDLVSIFNSINWENKELRIMRGYDAAEFNHMVQIGPYLLISIPLNTSRYKIQDYEVSDSLNSEFFLLFSEYHTSSMDKNLHQRYGYVCEAIDWNRPRKLENYNVSNSFFAHYYVILELDEIPEDYVLKVRASEDSATYKLTYDDIMYLLDFSSK